MYEKHGEPISIGCALLKGANRKSLSIYLWPLCLEVVGIDSIYKQFGIYRITNKINGNTYVGKTSVNFGDRWDCHKAQLRGGYHDNRHLQNAWKKYGEENFEFAIIESVTEKEKLNDLEKKYIKQYRDAGICYNLTDGGDGGFQGKHLSDEAKRKIGAKNKINMTGKKASEETKAKMSASQKKRFANMSEEELKAFGRMMSEKASGYTWSDESKQRFSEIQRTHPNGAKYTIDDVREIRRLYEVENKSFTEISEIMNIQRKTVYLIATYKRWKYAS